MRLVTHKRTTTARCFGLPSTISYRAIVSLVPVFLGDGMPAVDRADLKRRRRLASRVLVSGSRGGGTAKKKHLVDGVWLERLPFNANGTFPPNTPGPGRASVSGSGPRVDEGILFAESAQLVPRVTTRRRSRSSHRTQSLERG